MVDKACRVLVVDDDLKYAARMAAALTSVRPELLCGHQPEIDLSNTAYFVAEQLRRCPYGQASWDIIIADVYMPLPCKTPDNSPVLEAHEKAFPFGGRTWRAWVFDYPYGEDTPNYATTKDGGFRIAETVKELLDGGKDLANLKVVLISGRLEGADRLRLNQFNSERAWFDYYDKGQWVQAPGQATTQMPVDVFQWALALAIKERESPWWGSAAGGIAGAACGDAILGWSTGMQKVRTEARRLGQDTNVKAVCICGPHGTPRRAAAGLLCMARDEAHRAWNETAGPYVEVDPTLVFSGDIDDVLFGAGGAVKKAADGTLWVDNIDRLPERQFMQLVRIANDEEFKSAAGHAGRFEGRLLVCGVAEWPTSWDDLAFKEGWSLLQRKAAHIDIPALKDRWEDRAEMGRYILRSRYPVIDLAPSGEAWLKEQQDWPGNDAQLADVIVEAASLCTGDELGEGQLQRAYTVLSSRGLAEPGKGKSRWTKEQLREYRQAHPEISMANLSEVSGWNRTGLYRVFRQTTSASRPMTVRRGTKYANRNSGRADVEAVAGNEDDEEREPSNP